MGTKAMCYNEIIAAIGSDKEPGLRAEFDAVCDYRRLVDGNCYVAWVVINYNRRNGASIR